MKITRVRLKNVRGYRSAELDWRATDSVLLTGDNGDGKTTFLRALSMSFCDELGAAGLLSELPGQFVTYDEDEAVIHVELEHKNGTRYSVETKVINTNDYSEKVRQRRAVKPPNASKWIKADSKKGQSNDPFPYGDVFTVGYGSCLRVLGKERYQHYYPVDALYSLFKHDTQLQEQELAVRRLLDEADVQQSGDSKDALRAIKTLLLRMLNFDDSAKIELENNGIFFEGKSFHKSELTSQGDGVRAIVTLVLDLMSWWHLHLTETGRLKRRNFYDSEAVEGVVIIDEAALYLHPAWQRKIVSNFLQCFPNVQFIFSTHDPLCVSGATDFDDRVRFIRLHKDGRDSCAREYFLARGCSADDVLLSDAFGLTSTVSPYVGQLLTDLANLLESAVRSDETAKRIQELVDELENLSPQQAEMARNNIMRAEMRREMNSS